MNNIDVSIFCFCVLIISFVFCVAEQCSSNVRRNRPANNKYQRKYWSLKPDTEFKSVCNNNSGEIIIDYLKEHVDTLTFSVRPEVIFVIGSEKSNKTTLVLFLTNAELEAVETEPGSGRYVYVDKDGPLNQFPSHINDDLIPQVIPNKDNGMEFYIFHEFNVSSDVKNDITGTHMKQRLLKSAKGLKFLFTINYDAVKDGKLSTMESRSEIRELARNVSSLIKDIEKFKNAFSLVVTNVEYRKDVDETRQIELIAEVLRNTETDFVKMNEKDDITEEEEDLNLKCIDFLRELSYEVIGDDGARVYPRIYIFRLANETGLVANMTLLQEEKLEITVILQYTIEYVKSDVMDFQFNHFLSDDSMSRIEQLIEITRKDLQDDLSIINLELQDIYTRLEKNNADLSVILKIMEDGYNVISQLSPTDPREFVKQIVNGANALNFEVTMENFENILKHVEIIEFMSDLRNGELKESVQFHNDVGETIEYLLNSKQWYEYLIELHSLLSSYNVQKIVEIYADNVASIMELSVPEENGALEVASIGLKELVNNIQNSIPPYIEAMTVNCYKLESLRNVLSRAMNDQAALFCSPGKMEVRGYNIKISDVNQMECEGNITFMNIFALNILYINQDIVKIGE